MPDDKLIDEIAQIINSKLDIPILPEDAEFHVIKAVLKVLLVFLFHKG